MSRRIPTETDAVLQLALWGEPTPLAEPGPVGPPSPSGPESRPPAAVAGQMALIDLVSPSSPDPVGALAA